MITTEVEVRLEKLISNTLGIFTIKPAKLVNWIPGMFLQLSLTSKTASEPWLDSKPFSIASWGGEEMKIIVRKEGKFTTSLFARASKGFVSSMKYPLGNFYLNGGGKKFFIAGGAGISVFTSYLDFLTKEKIKEKLFLFHSAKVTRELLPSLYWYKIPENVEFISNEGKSSLDDGRLQRLTFDSLKKYFEKDKNLQFYLCGPEGFRDYWNSKLTSNGYNVKTERWIVS
ncbi:MAG: hypothetical protein B2I17_01930 [Thermoplasmatales archaeon B_DKE]|nr:MAG: hypothetical protein B2I17_01930 [Thermoplasmatales archaeon B_DKE]